MINYAVLENAEIKTETSNFFKCYIVNLSLTICGF